MLGPTVAKILLLRHSRTSGAVLAEAPVKMLRIGRHITALSRVGPCPVKLEAAALLIAVRRVGGLTTVIEVRRGVREAQVLGGQLALGGRLDKVAGGSRVCHEDVVGSCKWNKDGGEEGCKDSSRLPHC